MTENQKKYGQIMKIPILLVLLLIVGFIATTGTGMANSNKETPIIPFSDENDIPASSANPTPIVPDQDTYVEVGNPTSNFGGQDYLYIGSDIYGDQIYSYVHFNFTQKPTTFEKAYISLQPGVLYETMNISINLLDDADTWDEYTITYLTRPTTIIDHIDYRVSQDNLCWIDITPLFTRNELTDLSLMLSASLLHETYMTSYQKEMGSSSLFPPISLTFVEAGDAIDFGADDYVPESTEIVPTRDTYIDSDQAISNFGGLDSLRFGTGLFSNIYGALLHFEEIPTDTTTLDLELDLWSVDETTTIYLTIFCADNGITPWSELDLTWMNWPYTSVVSLMEEENVNISTIAVSSDVISIDLTSWIGYGALDIVLTLPLLTDDYIYCESYEGASWLYEPPKLIVDEQTQTDTTSDTTSSDTTTPSDEIAGFPLLSLISLGALAIGIVRRKITSKNVSPHR